MGKLITLLILACLAILAYPYLAPAPLERAVSQGDGVTEIRVGHNRVVLEHVDDFDEEYRVFGITVETPQDDPFNHVTAYFYMTPLEQVRRVWARDNCEARAAKQAKLVGMVIASPDLIQRVQEMGGAIDSQERFALRLSGSKVKVQAHEFEGKPIRVTGGSRAPDFVLLRGAEPVAW